MAPHFLRTNLSSQQTCAHQGSGHIFRTPSLRQCCRHQGWFCAAMTLLLGVGRPILLAFVSQKSSMKAQGILANRSQRLALRDRQVTVHVCTPQMSLQTHGALRTFLSMPEICHFQQATIFFWFVIKAQTEEGENLKAEQI